MRSCAAGGCLGGCALFVGIPLLIAALVVSLIGALTSTTAARTAAGRALVALPLSGAEGTLANLGFGPSDGARIDRAIAARTPHSPLVGHGAAIVAAATGAGLDPLLIVGVWALESQLCTDGKNTPANGNFNCGNMIWDAMRLHASPTRWGCTVGGASLGHQWGYCPTLEGGIGIWAEYVSNFYGPGMPLGQFANIYNPCSDPENARNGFPCGDVYGRNILAVVTAVAGPPTGPPAGPAVAASGHVFPIAGFRGPVPLHHGRSRAAADLFAPEGTPILSVFDGRVAAAGYDTIGGYYVLVDGTDRQVYYYSHLAVPPAVIAGQTVTPGQVLGLVGNTGNASQTPPHVHFARGPSIISGVGPDGGGGSGGADVTTFLQNILDARR